MALRGAAPALPCFYRCPHNLSWNNPVGASLLAKVVNDNDGVLSLRGAYGFFASKLAPTGGVIF
ncbi:hypothetical protein PflCFBP13510_15885 [Pseudomonas fluorescens]|nr:hypothetical protein CDH05_10275 [Pseudomonas lactis]TKK08591.1 hypothetical protein PflCFBP13510_15885 [Pseudomonas fluorescens]